MKTNILMPALLLAGGLAAPAAVSWSGSVSIADGNLSGYFNTLNVTAGEAGGSSLTALTLTLTISGGYNGDLYAYVSHNGVLVPLFNRVGVGSANVFGYGDAGFAITLSTAGTDLHNYGGNGGSQLTGIWQPDGRPISPLSSPASFDAAARTGFSAFTGMDPTGDWTLFVADVMPGGDASKLTSWSLGIEAAPEPMNVAAELFGGLFGGFHLLRCAWRKGRAVPKAAARHSSR